MYTNYKIFDSHSHFAPSNTEVFSIQNWDYWKDNEPIPQGHHSIGLHPWHLSKMKNQNDVETFLQDRIGHPLCLAVGEVGLDYFRSDVSREQQEMIFEWVLNVSFEFPQKPLIIHSVRSESQIVKILNETKRLGPVIWHNYLLNQYPKTNFDLYASVSPRILKLKLDRRLKIISNIPSDKILIESDDRIGDYSSLKSFMNETGFIDDENIAKNTIKVFSLYSR